MPDSVLQYVVPSALGLVSGVIGSLFAPWVHWGIEKRKQRLEARREFIQYARQQVRITEDMREFRASQVFVQLRPHLSGKTVELLNTPANHVHIGMSGGMAVSINAYQERVLEDINRLEQKWKLI